MIITDADGLSTARITIDVGGFAVPAYTARPREGAGLPVVLVLSETYGLHPHIQDVTRRFAHEGFLAVAPDLMARQGDPGSYADVNRLVTDLLQHIPDEQVLTDLDGVLEWAVTHGGDPDRATVNGFSWGGRWTWLFAAHSERLAAAVSWYGVLDDTHSGLYPGRDLFPYHPIDLADRIQTPTLGLYAGQDQVVTVDTVDAMKKAVAARPAGAPPVEFVVYPDAVHGFHADYRDDYDEAAARDGWQRAVTWLRQNHG